MKPLLKPPPRLKSGLVPPALNGRAPSLRAAPGPFFSNDALSNGFFSNGFFSWPPLRSPPSKDEEVPKAFLANGFFS